MNKVTINCQIKRNSYKGNPSLEVYHIIEPSRNIEIEHNLIDVSFFEISFYLGLHQYLVVLSKLNEYTLNS